MLMGKYNAEKYFRSVMRNTHPNFRGMMGFGHPRFMPAPDGQEQRPSE